MAQSELERLVAVETNLKNVTESVRAGFAETKESIKELSQKVDLLTPTLVTEEKHNTDLQQVFGAIKEIRRQRWVQNTLSAILGATLTLLVAYFITNVSK